VIWWNRYSLELVQIMAMVKDEATKMLEILCWTVG
jgi:hypothetical protein